MTSEKSFDPEGKSDYANLAFNPYAISTDDLTFSTFGNDSPTKTGKAKENGGFEPEMVVEDNPHYEDTLEVAKKAGLTGTGRRKKENVVYEEAGYKKKSKEHKHSEKANGRTSYLPPNTIEDWSGISKNGDRQWKLPFIILCFFVVICLVGAVMGVLAYWDEKECSCNLPESQALAQASINKSEVALEKQIQVLMQKLESLTAKLERKIEQTQGSLNVSQQQFNRTIEATKLAFNMKLSSVTSNVSSLNTEMDELRTELRSVSNFTQQLSNKLEDVNSTIASQLQNVSKQVGPRGFNGSRGLQGLQGPQGVGNISACTVHETSNRAVITGTESLLQSSVSATAKQGYKIISAVCSTKRRAGAIQTVLSRERNGYTCTCAGVSIYAQFEPARDVNNQRHLECVIIYWQCPELN